MSRNCILKELTINDGNEIYNMLQHIIPGNHKFSNEVYGMKYEEYTEWLMKRKKWAQGIDLPEGYVKEKIFWLYFGNMPIGIGKLRERLTENSRRFGGNIGYAISDEFRGKGYGAILLGLLLIEADRLNIKEKMITIEKNNFASKRIAEKCNGILFDENEKRWFYKFE